jgi:uncharacterized phage protein (TIGR02220 family)
MHNSIEKKERFAFIFSPEVWLRDVALQMCCLQTHGAWMRLLCYMYQSEKRGHLFSNGKPLSVKQIQKMLAVGDKEFASIWGELTEQGVIKFDEATGSYYSKRMVNDYKKFLLKESLSGISDENMKIIESVIKYLNEKSRKDFDIKNANSIKLINEKILAGHKENDFKRVIDTKCTEWIDNEKCNIFLRPSTLFGAKMDEYLNQSPVQKKSANASTYIKVDNPYKDMMR